MSRVLCIPDLHSPFIHKRALKFCRTINEEYSCDRVVIVGDLFDQYCFSRYAKDPDSLSPRSEIEKAKRQIHSWVEAFPSVDITYGNHDMRLFKRLRESNIPPDMFVKSYNKIFGLPDTWRWSDKITVDRVLYMHGSKAGEYSHVNIAKDLRRSVVSGHTHSSGGVHYISSYDDTIFGMNVGCLIDSNCYAFAYASEMTRQPVLGAGVIIDGFPTFIPLR